MTTTCTVEGCDSTPKRGGRGLCPKHYQPLTTFPAESLRPIEVDQLLAATNGSRWTDRRNHALIMLLVGTGIRIGEALALTPADIDLERGSLFVRHGKGNKARPVAILRMARPTMREWLPLVRGPLVFSTAQGEPLDHRYVRAMFTRLGKKACIQRHVHPHAMRHTFAVNAAREKVSPTLLQRQLGHSNLGTTTRYLSTISADEVIDAFDAIDREEDS